MSLDIRNMDCIEYMLTCKDNEFDLAIVDPPYGINLDTDHHWKWKTRPNYAKKQPKYSAKEWDKATPNEKYFMELFRISKNQIVWGGNYLHDFLPISGSWICWDKKMNNTIFAQIELAWTSFTKPSKKFACHPFHKLNGGKDKQHPTQKPIQLYNFLLKTYAEQGQKILDTHLGSGSSAIAAHYFGCEFVGLEIDKEYFEDAMQRIKRETAQVEISFNHSIISCGEEKKENNENENVA